MQSVGEVMAIGRTFPESLQKALRSLETGRGGLNADPAERILDPIDTDDLVLRSATPDPERVFLLEAALRPGVTVEPLAQVTAIDPWFLDQFSHVPPARSRPPGTCSTCSVSPVCGAHALPSGPPPPPPGQGACRAPGPGPPSAPPGPPRRGSSPPAPPAPRRPIPPIKPTALRTLHPL